MSAPDRSRECKGCGGSGRERRPEDEIERYDVRWIPPCPACLGSGRVTDGPFRRDAEVDAETLRTERRAVGAVTWCGNQAAWRMRVGMRSAAVWAVDAANAAFRAVPGLRGE